MGPAIALRLRQHLTLTPQVQQALRLLQMSAMEFAQEMEQALASWSAAPPRLIFSPHLLPVSRGLLATIYAPLASGWTESAVRGLYADRYASEPFVRLLPPAQQGRLLDGSGMKQLETAQANLESFVTAQQELLQEVARQQAAQAEILNLINQARLARDQADYDDAIPLYEKALAKAGQPAKLAQELAALKARWQRVGGPELGPGGPAQVEVQPPTRRVAALAAQDDGPGR